MPEARASRLALPVLPENGCAVRLGWGALKLPPLKTTSPTRGPRAARVRGSAGLGAPRSCLPGRPEWRTAAERAPDPRPPRVLSPEGPVPGAPQTEAQAVWPRLGGRPWPAWCPAATAQQPQGPEVAPLWSELGGWGPLKGRLRRLVGETPGLCVPAAPGHRPGQEPALGLARVGSTADRHGRQRLCGRCLYNALYSRLAPLVITFPCV